MAAQGIGLTPSSGTISRRRGTRCVTALAMGAVITALAVAEAAASTRRIDEHRAASGATGPTGATGTTGAHTIPTFWPPAAYRAGDKPTLLQFHPATGGIVEIGAIHAGAGEDGPASPISWTGWGSPTAVGAASAYLLNETSAATPPVYGEHVKVQLTLGGLTGCGDVNIYTTLTLALAPGAEPPTNWDFGEVSGVHRSSSCWPVGGCPAQTSVCTRQQFSFGATWHDEPGSRVLSKPFGFGSFTTDIRLHGWGGASTVGTGFVWTPDQLSCYDLVTRCPYRPTVYPVRYALFEPRWCYADGLYYTEATVVAYGAGRRAPSNWAPEAPPPASYDELLRDIGRPGIITRVTRGSIGASAGCL
jgi:hypothetical protein